MIEQLLTLARIIQGKLSLSINQIALVPVTETAIDTVSIAAEAKNICLKPQLDANINLVLGDATRWQQVMKHVHNYSTHSQSPLALRAG